jgi:trans-aconitate methyltransferase
MEGIVKRGELPKARWDSALYESKCSFVWKFGEELVEILSPQPGERILDLGCGTGHLTAHIAASGAQAIGMDNSSTMVDQARKAYPQLQFEVADAASFYFEEPFDAVFSNAVLHWIKEAGRVIDCVWRNLKPGGRFVVELGGKGNIREIHAAFARSLQSLGLTFEGGMNPWYFPSLGDYATLLEKRGFRVADAKLFDRPTPLDDGGAGMRIWIKMFSNNVLDAVPPGKHDEFIRSVEDILRPKLYRNGTWIADYRRLRVLAWKETEAEPSAPAVESDR